MDNKPIIRLSLEEDESYIGKQSWWVKIHEPTSRILQISSRMLREDILEDSLIFECWNPLCGEILQGKTPKKWVGPVYDIENKVWDIAMRGRNILLETLSNKLQKIEIDFTPAQSDVYLKVYKDTNSIGMFVNFESIKRTMNLIEIEEIRKTDGTFFNLFFTGKNDPDYLIDSVEIDPFTLLSKKSIEVPFPDVIKYRDWEDISIYTRPIFHNYGMEILEKHIGKKDITNKNTLLRRAEPLDIDTHFTIYKSGTNKIKIVKEVNEQQDYLITSLKKIPFIVCDTEVDNYVGGFEIPGDVIRDKHTIEIETKFDIPANPLLLYRNKQITINYLGEQNV